MTGYSSPNHQCRYGVVYLSSISNSLQVGRNAYHLDMTVLTPTITVRGSAAGGLDRSEELQRAVEKSGCFITLAKLVNKQWTGWETG